MLVVHCKKSPYTVYCGRPSPLGNPFPIGPGCTREESIAKFEEYARNNPEVLEWIKVLPEDAVLACWCAPKPCHCDVIIKLWKELNDVA
jgi:hypothetical protein